MDLRRPVINSPVVAVGLFLLFLYSSTVLLNLGLSFGGPGTVDFIQYWSAFQLWISGKNPYDPELILGLQQQLGLVDTKPITLWAPPWVLILLAPVLVLPFEQAALLWLGLGFCFIFLAVLMIRAVYAPACPLLYLVVAAAFFPPCWEALAWGQVSLLLLVSIALFLYSSYRGLDIVAGLCLVPLTVKPHLFLSLLPLIGFWIIQRKRWQVAVAFAVALIVLCLILIIQGESLSAWVISFKVSSADKVSLVSDWYAATLADFIRYLVLLLTGKQPLWPRLLVPLLALLAAGVSCLFLPRSWSIARWFPPFLCLSLLAAPYGWYYDQSVLLLVPLSVICAAFSKADNSALLRTRSLIITVLAFLQLGLMIFILVAGDWQHYFFWYPAALLFFWCWAVWLLDRCSRA